MRSSWHQMEFLGKMWLSISVLSSTTSAFQAVSQRVLQQPGHLVFLSKTSQVFQTVSKRVRQPFLSIKNTVISRRKALRKATISPELTEKFQDLAPASLLTPSLTHERPPPFKQFPKIQIYSEYIKPRNGVNGALRWLSETLTNIVQDEGPETMIIKKRNIKCKSRSNCVPIVVFERDHVLIFDPS